MRLAFRHSMPPMTILFMVGLNGCFGPPPATVPAQDQGISVERTMLGPVSAEGEAVSGEIEGSSEGEPVPVAETREGFDEDRAVSSAMLAEDFEALPLGISYEDAVAAMGERGRTSGEGESLACRWRSEGRTYVARFEGGKLARKAVLGSVPVPAKEVPQGPVLTAVAVSALEEGMRVSDADALLGLAGERIGADEEGGAAYRWRDGQGNRCTAWFQEDRLVRKSGLYRAGSLEETPAAAEAEQPALAGGESDSSRETITIAAPAEENPPAQVEVESVPPEEPTPSTPVAEEPEAVAQRSKTGKVVVLGAAREPAAEAGAETSDEGRVTRLAEKKRARRAQLPGYSHSLRRGVYRLRIENAGESTLMAGLRAGRWGQDVKVAPGKTQELRLDRGAYHLYFISGSDPYTLRDGGAIRIDGESLSDARVVVYETDAEIESLSIEDLW